MWQIMLYESAFKSNSYSNRKLDALNACFKRNHAQIRSDNQPEKQGAGDVSTWFRLVNFVM